MYINATFLEELQTYYLLQLLVEQLHIHVLGIYIYIFIIDRISGTKCNRIMCFKLLKPQFLQLYLELSILIKYRFSLIQMKSTVRLFMMLRPWDPKINIQTAMEEILKMARNIIEICRFKYTPIQAPRSIVSDLLQFKM